MVLTRIIQNKLASSVLPWDNNFNEFQSSWLWRHSKWCYFALCSKPNCRLLVTHDDYSVTLKLPKQKTSVVTILRSPLDRIFSTYEFSVEVAARFLVHPSLKSVMQMSNRLRPKTKGVSTLDIWPWKYLVPWMREDLFGRVWFLWLYAAFLSHPLSPHQSLLLLGVPLVLHNIYIYHC